MGNLDARLRVLEGGTKGGTCLACELETLNRAVAGEGVPLLGKPATRCTHRPTTLARELAGMPQNDEREPGATVDTADA